MNDSVSHAIEVVRSGNGTGEYYAILERYLRAPIDPRYLDEAVTVYYKYVPNVGWEFARRYVRYPDDPLVSATTILTASLAGCDDKSFWLAVRQIACGEEWDSEGEARIMAILALGRSPDGCNDEVRLILRTCATDKNPSVRDCVAIAAQRCCGIPEGEVLSGGRVGQLLRRLQPHVLRWLDVTKPDD
jgi:hypothetical protein